jgi:hypothetical protein
MKKDKIIYWVSTMLIVLPAIMGGISHFVSPQYLIESFNHLGYPQYFRYEMAIANILGAFVLVLPKASTRFKEWAYFGFGLVYISALYSHIWSGDGASLIMAPILFLLILSVSYNYNIKINNNSEKK